MKLYQKQKFSPKKLAIINFYLTHQIYNGEEIAEKMGLSYTYIIETINEWVTNERTITVASKLCD